MVCSARNFPYLLVVVLVLLVGACGGGSGDTANNQPTGSGSVALLFTDAPDPVFDEINVTITRIVLISDDDAPTELFSGEKIINLLDLENHADLFSYTGNIPAKTYSKIRLHVSNVELVRKDTDGNIIETITPKLPGNGKIDLNPRGAFEVLPDQTLTLEIDVDARKSIHIHQLGNGGYIFRPVIFIKRLADGVDGKFIRMEGEITDLDTTEQSFRLCKTSVTHQELESDTNGGSPVSTHLEGDSKWCPLVHIADATVLYGPDGEPLLVEELVENSTAMVFGRFSHNDGDNEKPVLNALTVLVGPASTFTAYEGTAASIVDNIGSRFDLDLAAGQGIVNDNPLPVQLQPGAVILSTKGDVLDTSAIEVGKSIKVIGLLRLSDTEPDFIKAVLVFVDTDVADIKLSGTISTINLALDGFTLISDSDGDRCVTLTGDTNIFLISEDNGSFTSEEIQAADLFEGQTTDVYGHYNLEGCLVADSILAGAT